MEPITYFQGKPIYISRHAIIRAEERRIAYPKKIINTIQCGKVKKIGKQVLIFRMYSKKGSTICIGIDLGQSIIIKTIERGN